MNQDVWVRDKGIHYEDIPRKHPETFPELNERCYATFGTKKSFLLKKVDLDYDLTKRCIVALQILPETSNIAS